MLQRIYIDPLASSNLIGEDYNAWPYVIGEDDILYYDYGDRYKGIGLYANPTYVAKYVVDLFSGCDSQKNIKRILTNVDFLLDSAVVDDTGAYWPYPFDNPHYNVSAGWYSGMTNGRVLGALVIAHCISGNEKYLDFAQKVFRKLSAPSSLGGLTDYSKNGAWIKMLNGDLNFYVLNSHIFAMSGVYSYAEYVSNESVRQYFLKSINRLAYTLKEFDTGFISLYSLRSSFNSPMYAEKYLGYNYIHVFQLLWLYEISGNPLFLEYASRFMSYEALRPFITASFSTAPDKNGPEKADFLFGNSYWSSYNFPVVFTINYPKEIKIGDIFILSHLQETSPSDFSISYWDSSGYKVFAKKKRNQERLLHIPLSYKVETNSLRVDISKGGTSGIVALDGVGVKGEWPSVVANLSNFSPDLVHLSDGNPETGVVFSNDGWVLIGNLGKSQSLDVFISGLEKTGCQNVIFSSSNDLRRWEAASSLFGGDRFSLKNVGRYLKLNVDGLCSLKINEVVIN